MTADRASSVDRHVARGRTLIDEGRTAQAGVELRKAMRLKPGHAEPLFLADDEARRALADE